MSSSASGNSARVLWKGKPWILPAVVARSILIIVAAAVVFWFEFFFGIAQTTLLNIQLILWTGLLFLLAWIFSSAHALLLRASDTYILRDDSLEIRFGILTSRTVVISPSGFSDLEVIRSISDRIVNSGTIIIRTQSENKSDLEMKKVRSPQEVAAQIREVMARPIVRMEGQKPSEEKNQ